MGLDFSMLKGKIAEAVVYTNPDLMNVLLLRFWYIMVNNWLVHCEFLKLAEFH
jgi:hypothetical protein